MQKAALIAYKSCAFCIKISSCTYECEHYIYFIIFLKKSQVNKRVKVQGYKNLRFSDRIMLVSIVAGGWIC